MAWQETTTVMVRMLVDDLDESNYTYSNERVEQSILVSAQLVNGEADFQNEYEVNLTQFTLSPDPTETTPQDNDYINLVAYRAACLILSSEVKASVNKAVLVKDGPSTIDMRNTSGTLMDLRNKVCEKFEDMLMDYKAGKSIAGQSILGPNSPASWAYSSGRNRPETRTNTF